MKNQKAIAVYLDNSDKMETELSWLYKTWILYSLEDEFDLIVYYHPSAKERLNNFVGVIPVEMPYIEMSLEYKFLNSHYFCSNGWNEPLKKYKFLMKTDCDVFLTQNIKGYTPSSLLVGQGGYYDLTDTNKIDFLKSLSNQLGFKWRSMPLVGASFFGRTEDVLGTVQIQAKITEFILKNYSDSKSMPFDVGVASMIAGEIVINAHFTNQHIKLYCLDDKCWEYTKIGSNVIHIHAWHTDQRWSKHAYFLGQYSDWKVDLKDAFSNAANYCQWIARSTNEDILLLKKKIKDGSFIPDYKLME